MRAERNLVFATSRMVFAYVRKDTVVLDATSVSKDIMAIPTVYHAIAAPLAHPALVAIPRASARASPILPERLVVNAAQDTINIRNASVCNIICAEILVIYDVSVKSSCNIFYYLRVF